MQAPPPLASTGLPWASSAFCTMPLVSDPQPMPKSEWLSLKSRKIAGTRRMQRPSFISHERFVVHMKPASNMQADEQPSPSFVLPSSHSSSSTRPSPHCEVQGPPLQLGSAWQVFEQPSRGMSLPSSPTSAPSFLPSPQVVGVHTLGMPSHLNPSSSLQRLEQPSPSAVLPSSQSSELATILSPQRATG